MDFDEDVDLLSGSVRRGIVGLLPGLSMAYQQPITRPINGLSTTYYRPINGLSTSYYRPINGLSTSYYQAYQCPINNLLQAY